MSDFTTARVTALVLLSFLAACGGGGNGGDPPPTAAPAPAPAPVPAPAPAPAPALAPSPAPAPPPLPALTWADAPTFIDRLHGQAPANDGLLLLTDDGGQHWRTVRAPSPGPRHFNDAQNGWLFGASPFVADTLAFATTDGGTTWQALPNVPLNNVSSIWTLGPTRLVLTGLRSSDQRAASLLSEDGGRTWRQLPLKVDDVAPSGLMSGDELLALRLSTDGGKTARTILEYWPNGPWPWMQDLSDPERLQLIVSSSSGYEHRSSADGGVTWVGTPVVLPADVRLYPDSRDGARLVGNSGWSRGTAADGTSVLLRSADGGRHWSLAPLPAGLTGHNDVQTIRFHGESLLTLQGYQSDAWVSRDGATNWQPVRLSDPSALVELKSAGGGVLLASTGEIKTVIACETVHSRCVTTETIIHRRYVSSDDGITWRLMPGGQPIKP